ncbi:MAG: hypothetical protein LBP65_01715 [Puniceicoccales bacterium]|jgi:hypothetical protein|nr:hypothetical protein [Puniceicoccales bacterium]
MSVDLGALARTAADYLRRNPTVDGSGFMQGLVAGYDLDPQKRAELEGMVTGLLLQQDVRTADPVPDTAPLHSYASQPFYQSGQSLPPLPSMPPPSTAPVQVYQYPPQRRLQTGRGQLPISEVRYTGADAWRNSALHGAMDENGVPRWNLAVSALNLQGGICDGPVCPNPNGISEALVEANRAQVRMDIRNDIYLNDDQKNLLARYADHLPVCNTPTRLGSILLFALGGSAILCGIFIGAVLEPGIIGPCVGGGVGVAALAGGIVGARCACESSWQKETEQLEQEYEAKHSPGLQKV